VKKTIKGGGGIKGKGKEQEERKWMVRNSGTRKRKLIDELTSDQGRG